MLEQKTFETSPGKNFKLKAFSGDVLITTSDDPVVYIKIYGNERAKRKVKFDFENTDEGVTVTTEGHDNWNFFNFGNGVKLKFEIRLPKTYNANVSSSGGDIRLEDLTGKIELSSSGGDITLKNVDGNTAVSTSGGDVNLDNAKGSFDLKTSGGDIKSLDYNGDLYASTSGGDIDLRGGNGKIDAHTSGGEINLDYTGKNMGVNLESSGGDIKIKLPQDFNAEAKMSASGGSIHCEFEGSNVTNISSGKYEGDFNNGGPELIAKTSGGDITVTKK
jgi:uncharacterized protein involved in outer membrane biogenesis